jgi:hypothetical protein
MMFVLSRTISFFVCLKTILSFENPENVYPFLIMHFRILERSSSFNIFLFERPCRTALIIGACFLNSTNCHELVSDLFLLQDDEQKYVRFFSFRFIVMRNIKHHCARFVEFYLDTNRGKVFASTLLYKERYVCIPLD